MTPYPPGHRLHEFLLLSRQRVQWRLLAPEAGRMAFWAGLACVPLLACRRALGVPAGVLVLLAGVVALLAAEAVTFGRRLRREQVLRRLDLSADAHDRVTSGTDFLADPGPFQRLAVRDAEAWLARHEAELACRWRWPREAKWAPLVLALLALAWWLAPPPRVARPALAAAAIRPVAPPPATPPLPPPPGASIAAANAAPQTQPDSAPPTPPVSAWGAAAHPASGATPSPSTSGTASSSGNPPTGGAPPSQRGNPAAGAAARSAPAVAAPTPNPAAGSPGSATAGASAGASANTSAAPGRDTGAHDPSAGRAGRATSASSSTPGNAAGATPGARAGASPGANVGAGASPGGGTATGQPGGAEAGVGHFAPLGAASSPRVPGATIRIEAAAVATQPGGRPEQPLVRTEDRADDPAAAPRLASGALPPRVTYDGLELNTSELEALPPQRRALVLRYFRSLRAAGGAATQPAPQIPPEISP